ncbi:hypothetical protein A3I95_00620 [Candidatus Nomurabacteria bacterium RIFCSPLOWO2_02_FULL_44_12]|uniref:DUF4190 domain-containing protein n=1 Tax=Candidatus Nomurabacteria bacterium RIFCSPLOWO2_12_FULL_44_11 TaxID=1801796 RepID=A0A1F6Y7V9_9BACT|nr:MAG: hypothetical protein A3G53_01090 [Candidatus Nomurabacteria bacterium RIFCSPLOWO2_12_FULL_44_11]OGJ07309.1 MAG: hypothetical protein A3I95_00620 [Candidatus Nomurabacteria bacterium RIFCSPLOWO2_02_FULL_44_12]
MKKISIPILLLTLFTPLLALAQAGSGVLTGTVTDQSQSGLTGVLAKISDLMDALLPFLVSLGVIYFIWGVVQYFIGDNEEAKTKGRDRIIFGIIGLAVIVSVWGLVTIIGQTLGVGSESAPNREISNLVVQQNSGAGCTQLDGPKDKLQDLLGYVTCLIGSSVIPFIFALAVAMFIWGAVKFLIINGGEEEKRNEGKQLMLWGIIALVVMISVWGLVKVVGNTFDLPNSTLPEVRP